MVVDYFAGDAMYVAVLAMHQCGSDLVTMGVMLEVTLGKD